MAKEARMIRSTFLMMNNIVMVALVYHSYMQMFGNKYVVVMWWFVLFYALGL